MLTYLLTEGIVYFLCALGFPDFVMNTLVFKKRNWVRTEDLPPTLILCAAVPGTIIAGAYLNEVQDFDMRTIAWCVAAIGAGCLAGTRFLGKIKGNTLKKVMAVSLAVSAVMLIVRMVLQKGAPQIGSGLNAKQLAIAMPFVFLFGFINMFGVPMKPMATVLFLMLGLSPLHTLTLMLILGCVSPLIGSVKALRNGRYHRKLVISSATAGTVGALVGIQLAIEINQIVLSVLLIAIICFTVVVLLRSKE